jgi:hypothetical protein
LEEVEIQDFRGENHGFDFLKLIFKCAPKLTKVTIRVGKRITPSAPGRCAKKIYRISLAYPSVKLYVYLKCGKLVPHP